MSETKPKVVQEEAVSRGNTGFRCGSIQVHRHPECWSHSQEGISHKSHSPSYTNRKSSSKNPSDVHWPSWGHMAIPESNTLALIGQAWIACCSQDWASGADQGPKGVPNRAHRGRSCRKPSEVSAQAEAESHTAVQETHRLIHNKQVKSVSGFCTAGTAADKREPQKKQSRRGQGLGKCTGYGDPNICQWCYNYYFISI